jgi:hypothetical protein
VSAGLRLVRLGVVICLAGQVLVVLFLFTARDRLAHARLDSSTFSDRGEAGDVADLLALAEPVSLFLGWSLVLVGRLHCARVPDPRPARWLALASVAVSHLAVGCLLGLSAWGSRAAQQVNDPVPAWGVACLFGYPLAGVAGEALFLWYLRRLGQSLGSKPLVRAATLTLIVGGVLTGVGLLTAVVFRTRWPSILFPPLLGYGGYLLWSGLLLFPYLYLVGPARQAVAHRLAAAAPVPTPDPGPT